MPYLKSILLLALAGLLIPFTSTALAAPAPVPSPADIILTPLPVPNPKPPKPSGPFKGVGQIRTRWSQGDYADLGCLTKEGRWTANETLCGVFRADRYRPDGYEIDVWKLASKGAGGGPCGLYGARFVCEAGGEGYEFGAWLWPTAIPGVECLRYGKYGLMASYESNPPAKSDAPEEIHLVSYREVGKYVWLTWSPLE